MLRDKENIKATLRNVILIFCLIAASFVLLPGAANAYERPEYKDGLEARWHPGSFCIPCHYTLLGNEKAKSISSRCINTCHSAENRQKNTRSRYRIDMNRISSIHKEIVCIRCHVGMKSGRNMTPVQFHGVMSRVQCMNCHIYKNGTYIKPSKTRCIDCHGSNPHVVHGKKLGKMCVICHGEFGEKYADRLEVPSNSNISIMSRAIGENMKREEDREYPTIGEILTGIFRTLMR